jgi:hypothetical protein
MNSYEDDNTPIGYVFRCRYPDLLFYGENKEECLNFIEKKIGIEAFIRSDENEMSISPIEKSFLKKYFLVVKTNKYGNSPLEIYLSKIFKTPEILASCINDPFKWKIACLSNLKQ